MSQSQVHQGETTMGVEPIVVRPVVGLSQLSQASEVHQGRVSTGAQTVVGQPV